MNTYFVSRWGNVADGANGPDTNFLVAAASVEEAGRLSDACLLDHPWFNGPNVCAFTNMVTELGTSLVEKPTVIHGPWIMNAILRGQDEKHPRTWRRVLSPEEPWEFIEP